MCLSSDRADDCVPGVELQRKNRLSLTSGRVTGLEAACGHSVDPPVRWARQLSYEP